LCAGFEEDAKKKKYVGTCKLLSTSRLGGDDYGGRWGGWRNRREPVNGRSPEFAPQKAC